MVAPVPASVAADLRRDLLAWFAGNRRDLPWRRNRTLYGTWISEMMLQQTTVSTVVPYWDRFLRRFPDVASLASAAQEDVLSLWSGLGYYRRARQLHAAARCILAEHDGRLPLDHDGWLALPGVGPYAAGAIASMGLGEVVPAVDANARRVLLRWATDDPGMAAAATARQISDLGASLVPVQAPGDWNEALMELGALICRGRNPACDDCPVRGSCRAGLAGLAKRIPPPSAVRLQPTSALTTALVAGDGHRVLLMSATDQPVLRPASWGEPLRGDLSNLHRGLWGPPVTAWYPDTVPVQEDDGGWRSWLSGTGAPDECRMLPGKLSHGITRWRLRVVVVVAAMSTADLNELVRRVGGQAEEPGQRLPLSRLARKIMSHAGWTSVDR